MIEETGDTIRATLSLNDIEQSIKMLTHMRDFFKTEEEPSEAHTALIKAIDVATVCTLAFATEKFGSESEEEGAEE